MATMEVSQRPKQFAYKYFAQVHARVKELERAREAEQPKRQPLVERGGVYFQAESTGHGGGQPTQSPDSVIHAAQALQNAAQVIDNAAEMSPELLAVSEELKGFAADIDRVVDSKIQTVKNRFSYETFRDAAASVLDTLTTLNVRQRVMTVYHVGAEFFLQEERNQGAGGQGTIQSWPEQYIRENPELNEAVEKAGGMERVLDSPVD